MSLSSSNADKQFLKEVIGEVWGKQWGKIQSTEAAQLKKVRQEYDDTVFHVDAAKIASKISRERERTVLQEFGEEGIRMPWDLQVLTFAKDQGIPLLTAKTILYVARDCLLDPLAESSIHPLERERETMLHRLGGDVDMKEDNIGAVSYTEYVKRCFPPVEFIRLFRDILELGRDTVDVVMELFDPAKADKWLRKRFVNREDYIDARGGEHKQPDQPLVGRNNENREILYAFGTGEEFYQARLALTFFTSIYAPFLNYDWLPDEAKEWVTTNMTLKSWVGRPLAEIRQFVNQAHQTINLKTYMDSLLTEVKNNYYGRRNFKALGESTKKLLDEFRDAGAQPKKIFSAEVIKARILENIRASVAVYFENNYKMPWVDVNQLLNNHQNTLTTLFNQLWDTGDYPDLYKILWGSFQELRDEYLQKRQAELAVEWEFAQEQRTVIESFDTIQKKHFSKITRMLRDLSPETGVEILDRTLALITLELAEIALSGANATIFQRKKFEETIIEQLRSEALYLLSQRETFAGTKKGQGKGIKPTFDFELEETVGETIAKYFQDTFGIIKDIFKTRDKFVRESLTVTEKYHTYLGLFDRYIRSGLEVVRILPREQQLETLKQLRRLNVLEFAKYIVLSANISQSLQEAFNEGRRYFGAEVVNLDGQAKYFDVLVFLRLFEDHTAEDTSKDQSSQVVRQLVERETDPYTDELMIKDCEKIIRVFLENQNIRYTQPYISAFRDKTYEWNVVRKVPKDQFVQWLASLDLSDQPTPGSAKTKDSAVERKVTLIYQDQTGDRKPIGADSRQALDAGLFQAVRPGEIIRQFGIQLRSLEFRVTDTDFPVNWIRLNHRPVVGADAQRKRVHESSIFLMLNQEPNIRNLDGLHTLIHRCLEGLERRGIDGDQLVDASLRQMITEILVEEDNEAKKFIEQTEGETAEEESIAGLTFNPFFLLDFKLRREDYRLLWDTIHVYGQKDKTIMREEFSTSGWPWVLDSANRFRTVMIDLFGKRMDGSVILTKASFTWPYNSRTYFTLADVDPDTLTARMVVFRSAGEGEAGEYNFVDIHRRLDLFLHQEPSKFEFVGLIDKMSATDSQLVIDKIEGL